jgi:hypothetical protein
MTTKVMILNLGPDPILVEPIGKDAQGRFADAGEPVEVPAGGMYGAVGMYVHDTLSYTVKEKPKG